MPNGLTVTCYMHMSHLREMLKLGVELDFSSCTCGWISRHNASVITFTMNDGGTARW